MTRWLLWDRQWGKTHAAVEWVKEDPERRVMVCATEEMAERVKREHGLTKLQACSWRQFRASHMAGMRPGLEVAVDDLELFLGSLLDPAVTSGVNVRLVTATAEPDLRPKGIGFVARLMEAAKAWERVLAEPAEGAADAGGESGTATAAGG